MPKFELTTMVMIQDLTTQKVLVQDRIKSWKGLSFPGGHVEQGESFVDCAVREIKEKTGPDVMVMKVKAPSQEKGRVFAYMCQARKFCT